MHKLQFHFHNFRNDYFRFNPTLCLVVCAGRLNARMRALNAFFCVAQSLSLRCFASWALPLAVPVVLVVLVVLVVVLLFAACLAPFLLYPAREKMSGEQSVA